MIQRTVNGIDILHYKDSEPQVGYIMEICLSMEGLIMPLLMYLLMK